MPELKRTFTGGKMEKDLDERIVPQGQYREALNIGVATSEDSDVGAAQNILGNIKVTSAISSRTYTAGTWGEEHIHGDQGKKGWNYHIAEIVDPQTDMLYRFIHTPNEEERVWMDRIVEYNTARSLDDPWHTKENAVMIDIFKVQARIIAHDCICDGSNKSVIQVDKNLNQLRWGMKITGGANECNIGEDITIERINYLTGEITLSAPIWVNPAPPQIPPIVDPCTPCGQGCCDTFLYTFLGDRNLNFSPERKITGINIIDGMIFWTDNFSEPKKINIERGKAGSTSKDFPELGRGQDKLDDFNQHTLLMVTIDNELQDVETCTKDESFCPPVGCMDDGLQPWSLYPGDPNATPNPIPPIPSLTYDPAAIYHDQSACCYFDGCTDNSTDQYGNYIYCNYDPNACLDDGSCCDKCGCTDDGSDPNFPGRPTGYVGQACNYDPTYCANDGSCVYGDCMDDMASNYNPNANCSNPSMCEYMWACVNSGYANNSCGDPETLPTTFPYQQGYMFIDNHPTNANAYDMGIRPDDNPEGSTWVNPNNYKKWASENGNVFTVINGISQPGMPPTSWMYSYGSGWNSPIGSLSWRKTDSGTWNCPANIAPGCLDGECNWPLNENDYTQGYYTDRTTKYIVVDKVWAQLDGKSYKDWNETTKLGWAWVYDGTSWISSQTNPTHPVFTNQPFGGLIDSNGHPLPGWWGMSFLPNQAPANQIYGLYEDASGNFWGGGGGEEPMAFKGKVCFGDCPNQFGAHENLVTGSLNTTTGVYSVITNNNVIHGGSTQIDMNNWFRDNGYDGHGPSIAANYGGTTCPTCNGQEHEKLMHPYHGLGAHLGTESIANYNAHHNGTGTYNPNGPNTGYTGVYFGTQQFWGAPGSEYAQYNYAQYPEVLTTDPIVEVWRKVTNNGGGWTWSVGGDMTWPASFWFVEEACECDGWNTNPTCQIDPNGTFANMTDCQNCTTCACNPLNISYNCINGSCVQIPGTSGSYPDLVTCQMSCIAPTPN